MTPEDKIEYERCKSSPYYFATKYLTVNGQRFTTLLSEDEYNRQFGGACQHVWCLKNPHSNDVPASAICSKCGFEP